MASQHTAELQRLDARACGPRAGSAGDPTWPSAHGAPSARITAPTATPGTISRTIRRARGAYRWNEDGLASISDDQQRLCFALALWNGHRSHPQGAAVWPDWQPGQPRRGCQGYYFYLDSTPTHSYMRMLYKYPQAAFPTTTWSRQPPRRGKERPGVRLIGTGVFAEDRYFDVLVEYAKAGAEDLLIRISATNRGPEAAALHLPDALVPQHLELGAAAQNRGPPQYAADRTENREPRAESRGPGALWANKEHRSRNREPRTSREPRTAPAGVRLRTKIDSGDHRRAPPALGTLPAGLRFRPGCPRAAVHRERDQSRAPLRCAKPFAVCERRHQRRGGQWPGRGGQPRWRGHARPRRTTS